MTLLVVTHVIHTQSANQYFAYGPYVREMNLWFKHVDKAIVIAPHQTKTQPKAIDLAYQGVSIELQEVPAFSFRSIRELTYALMHIPLIFYRIILGMQQADHIHLRCPGNMGLLGCIAQMFFPGKTKTAKYAGNWDWDSHQPWSYRLQQYLLQNTFLTRNMQTLVYGNWPGATNNIRPFFTATYSEADVIESPPRPFESNKPVRLLFVGSLSAGKNPLLTVQACQLLIEEGIQATLDLFGDGIERASLEKYIQDNQLEEVITLHGARDASTVKKAYQEAHFLILASQSEGWPKVVAEAMFWGCVPITTAVSCVPWMLGEGKRGRMIASDPEAAKNAVLELINNPQEYEQMGREAMDWSRQYTLEYFESEIAQLL